MYTDHASGGGDRDDVSLVFFYHCWQKRFHGPKVSGSIYIQCELGHLIASWDVKSVYGILGNLTLLQGYFFQTQSRHCLPVRQFCQRLLSLHPLCDRFRLCWTNLPCTCKLELPRPLIPPLEKAYQGK